MIRKKKKEKKQELSNKLIKLRAEINFKSYYFSNKKYI